MKNPPIAVTPAGASAPRVVMGLGSRMQLAAALARHPGMTVEPPTLPGLDPAWITPEGAIRTRPDHWADRGGLDGFFMVRLRRA